MAALTRNFSEEIEHGAIEMRRLLHVQNVARALNDDLLCARDSREQRTANFMDVRDVAVTEQNQGGNANIRQAVYGGRIRHGFKFVGRLSRNDWQSRGTLAYRPWACSPRSVMHVQLAFATRAPLEFVTSHST